MYFCVTFPHSIFVYLEVLILYNEHTLITIYDKGERKGRRERMGGRGEMITIAGHVQSARKKRENIYQMKGA